MTYSINTGKFTGRSPNDKYIVFDEKTKNTIWWSHVNKPVEKSTFDKLFHEVEKHYDSNFDEIYIFDGYCGASKHNRKKVRIITENVWQHHFVKNMFIEATREELIDFNPDFTLINSSSYINKNYKKDNLNSENFIMLDIEKSIGIIGGTQYTGEMKKSIFSLMNYWLPQKDVLTMHCSANEGGDGETTLFFGLSGTGKTTLSADPDRLLIGDDEHGWCDYGIFNLEGGCYAKTINLSKLNEPDIYKAIRPNALLENISYYDLTDLPNYNDISISENGRVSYPLNHINNFKKNGCGSHPKNIIFLTCDALGVLPIISKLDIKQSIFHFLSGYTSKISGCEIGIKEPIATFSSCYGEAFLTLPPEKYAEILKKKIEKHNINVYLVNTGWTKGKYGVGERVSIDISRKCINEIIRGNIDQYGYKKEKYFNLSIPKFINNINPNLLDPSTTWDNQDDYKKIAGKLNNDLIKNFEKFQI
jgi:phosphoenolpyruvate carboxykinase (ATP)